jgi:flagellar hook-basal body complex protein FliE
MTAIGSIAAAFNNSAVERIATQRLEQAGRTGADRRVDPAGGDFGSVIVNALEGLQATQNHADSLAVKAATGDLNDVHDYMIAAAEASLATEFTVAVRNRAVEAFNEIMRMQV